MSLVDTARDHLARRTHLTTDYYFSGEGLTPDPEIVAAMVESAKQHAAENIDDELYLSQLRSGTGRYTAARSLGIDPVLMMRRIVADQDFQDKVRVAEAEALEPVVATAHQLARKGEKWAAQFLLERKNSDEFGAPTKKLEIDHKHQHNHNHELVLKGELDPVDAEILQLEQDLREMHETRALNAGSIIDIPDEDIEEM
jgi:hypothetical protein